MSDASPGLHHVTAISGEPRTNWHFYTETLGLRLVKKTVNFDDPGTYHLYYGDRLGHPGTALTFFPFAEAAAGRRGAGEARSLIWRIPAGAGAFWAERLARAGIETWTDRRFGETRQMALDPDGFLFGLVASDIDDETTPWTEGPVPADRALRGFDGIDVASGDPDATARVLNDVFGYRVSAREDDITRMLADTDSQAGRSIIDLRTQTEATSQQAGRGSIHHIAFRARDAGHQARLAEAAQVAGLSPTPVIDRQYFESVYFREPGGVLFEIATDAPGFAIDENEATLGHALMLPPQYEPRRATIEAELPAL